MKLAAPDDPLAAEDRTVHDIADSILVVRTIRLELAKSIYASLLYVVQRLVFTAAGLSFEQIVLRLIPVVNNGFFVPLQKGKRRFDSRLAI